MPSKNLPVIWCACNICLVLPFHFCSTAHGDDFVPHERPPTGRRIPAPQRGTNVAGSCQSNVVRDSYTSIQVNVTRGGCNTPNDQANEPSIAVDPTDPRNIVIGWRQFNSVSSDFREPGWAYSHDGGHTWVFRGSLDPGVFGTDPVLAAGPDGEIYYLSINFEEMRLFRSFDGGMTWPAPTQVYPAFLDKPWITTDQTDGPGRGHIYVANGDSFFRSTDSGNSFDGGSVYPFAYFPTMSVDPSGFLFVVGEGCVYQSYSVQWEQMLPIFFNLACVSCTAIENFETTSTPDPNPGGLLGQSWVGTGPNENQILVYILNYCGYPYTNLNFFRSEDHGRTWSEPIRVHDDPMDNTAFQWFGMISVANNGRIDAVWNDTRNYPDAPNANLSELYYAYSIDGGSTWSTNVPASSVFDSHLGSGKLGDYYHMVSDNLGVNVAYAATFNGEQDIYFLRIGPWDCNGNEIDDDNDIAAKTSRDCNANEVPDECEYRADFNGDGLTTLDDFAAFQSNLTGPAVPIPADCAQLLDPDHDGDVDLRDFYLLSHVFTAP